MFYSTFDHSKAPVRNGKSSLKKLKERKFVYIKLEGLDRAGFITKWLEVHDLEKRYSPGTVSGPPFKMSWPQ